MKFAHALSFSVLFCMACTEQDKPAFPQERVHPLTNQHPSAQPNSSAVTTKADSAVQISQYIRRIFQDRDGTMWLGTEQDGVCRWDGRSLAYFTPVEGFTGTSVRGMAQDEQGDIWFATRGGVARFDGTGFTRWTTKDGLIDDQIWCLVLDRKGGYWFGTQEGVSRFDGKTFTPFPLPAADLSHFPTAVQSPKLINCMLQDRAGNIWIGSNGNGVYRYDGRTLTNFSKKDGLSDDFIQSMIEDRDGNLWFGTRFHGLCKYDGKVFTGYTIKDGLTSNLIWTLYQDRAGTIWMAATYVGLCSFDGSTFTCYDLKDRLGNVAVHSFLEDANGQLWVGTSSGLYRFDGKGFTNFTKADALRAH